MSALSLTEGLPSGRSGKKRQLNNRYEDESAKRSRKKRYTNGSHEENQDETDPMNTIFVGNLDAIYIEIFISLLYHLMKDLCILCNGNNELPKENVISIVKGRKRGTAYLFFVESRDATSALRLHNMPFMGKKIRLERPKTWEGPDSLREARYNWDHRLKRVHSGVFNTRGIEDSSSRESLLTRELVIRNIPYGCADLVHNYITSSMEQIGLVKGSEDPVEGFRLYHKSGEMGFLTFRNEEYARDAFRLQNLPFLNQFVRFERCRKDPSRNNAKDNKQDWRKSMNDFFHNIPTEECDECDECEEKVEDNVEECLPVGKQEHNTDGMKKRLEEAERKIEESQLQNGTLSAALSKKSRLLEACEGTIRSKDSEISRLQEEQTCLNATVKQVSSEKDSLKKELEGSNLRLTKALSSLTEAQRTTKIVQDSGEVDFLRKELEIKRTELLEKAKRIKELECVSERHMERIMNLTDGLLSEGTKQRKLEEKLQNERIRRISLETNLQTK